MSSNPVFSIIGGTLTGNRGAEAMVCSIVRSVKTRRPNARFHIFSYYPAEDRSVLASDYISIHSATPSALVFVHFLFSLLSFVFRLHRIPGIRKLLPVPVKALAESKALIDASGVSFMDGRIKFIPFNVLCILPALLLGVPVVKAAQGIGPCRTRLNRFFSRLILSRCRKVYARGSITFGYIRELGLPGAVVDEAADLAFLFESTGSLTDENAAYADDLLKRLESYREKVVGICPSSLVYSKSLETGWDYISFLTDLTRNMIEKGHRVLLFPNAVRLNKCRKLRNNDVIVIEQTVSSYKKRYGTADFIDYIDFNINAGSILRCIECCHCTIVSRFHAMILSLSAKIPVMVIGWSHKYQEVLTQFDLSGWALDHKKNTTINFLKQADKLLAMHDDLHKKISEGIPEVRNKAAVQIEYVLERL